ncbi:hypothetical protein [Lysinibacillus capsici]|uniref:hypothetical protein n=1 Tax=Lysinibacillus capsici TaxID=2115968 RepID=UPI003BAB33EC
MNYPRVRRLINEAITKLNLNLKGYTVYTEAGTGLYAVTPAIAIFAGAEKVYAISKDTNYGTAAEAFQEVEKIINDTELSRKLVKTFTKDSQHLYEADIVTNLGHVRPINEDIIKQLNLNKVVIPYMCEAWEQRIGDVDIFKCFKNNIPVMGTNEEHELINCFDSCGILAVKLLLEANLEIKGNKIAVYSTDKFGRVIYSTLKSLNADVKLFDNIKEIESDKEWLNNLDALIIADYLEKKQIVGKNGIINLRDISVNSPDVVIIPFAGEFDKEYADFFHLHIHPNESLSAIRMSRTLAHLGPKPTIDLLAGGLKVGQIMRNLKETTNSMEEVINRSANLSGWEGLAQRIKISDLKDDFNE